MAAVGGIEMKVAATTFAGLVVEGLVGETQGSGGGRVERDAIGGQQRIGLEAVWPPELLR